MESPRWLMLSPLVVAVAAGAIAPGPLAGTVGGDAAWDPPPCGADPGGPPADQAWYRLDPVLDRSGTLTARRLTVGAAGVPARTLDLAPESFASGPVNGLVLVGSDDGTRSRLRVLDPSRGCATEAGGAADVVRSALLAPDGRTVFEHRVDRLTRADLGVTRRTVGGPAELVLEGLAPDRGLGPTFVTDLRLAADGRLVVSSCAPAGCRVRVLDATGTVTMVSDTGPALGVTGDALVVRSACRGWPCGVEAIDLRTGGRSLLAEAAYAAVLGGPRDRHLVYETTGGRVASIDVGTGRRRGAVAAGAVPIGRGSIASAGAETRAGSVALAPHGRPGAGSVRAFDPAGPTRRHGETAR